VVKVIAKTELTTKLERNLFNFTNKQGTFGCFEVTIGWFGQERVDYLTYDTKGIWRFYEVKVSKADFYSAAKKTFMGHFNYFVMPMELFKVVKDDIPSHIGVLAEGNYSVKKAKKQELGIDEQILKNSLIRSLSRETQKLYKSEDPDKMNRMNRRIEKAEKEAREWHIKYSQLNNKCYAKYGRGWDE
jgi:hypothetical protein